MDLEVIDFGQICRACKCITPCMRSIFEGYQNARESPRIDEMLMACASVQVVAGDGLPSQICQMCVEQLNNAFVFKHQCEKSDANLREYAKNMKVNEIKEELQSSDFMESLDTLSNLLNEQQSSSRDMALDEVDPLVTPKIETDYSDFMNNIQLPLTCQRCVKIFTTLEDFRCHECIPTGNMEKRCGKEYKRLNHLQRHKRLRNRKKVYVCKICNKTWKKLVHLKRHLTTHLREKPFSCKTCNRGFNRLEYLQIHTPKCKGDTVYPCDICNKTFNREDNLEVHKKTHDNQQPKLPTIENLDKIEDYYYEMDEDVNFVFSDHSDVDDPFEHQIGADKSMDEDTIKEVSNITQDGVSESSTVVVADIDNGSSIDERTNDSIASEMNIKKEVKEEEELVEVKEDEDDDNADIVEGMSYEAQQGRLLRLWEEYKSNEEAEAPDDQTDDEDQEDILEPREGDSESEQEPGSDFEFHLLSSGTEYIGRNNNTRWNKHPFSQSVKTKKSNIVIGPSGVKGEAKNTKTILECWQLFFTNAMLDSIVENTNKNINTISEKYSRARDVYPTNIDEMKALFGLLYLAGCFKGSGMNTEDLWDRHGFGVEMFRVTMSLQRFRFLLRALRTDDKGTRSYRKQFDKLAPIRDLFNDFVTNCQTHYIISQYATIDEKLEAFRGRCSFRHYIPSKPSKYGLKIFVLVDAKMYYTLNLEVYVGIQPDGPFKQANDARSVVERLIQPISGTGRNVTMDNWFTSYELVECLLQKHNLTLVGTVRKDKREVPPEFVNTKSRPVCSSVFGYQKDKTLVSYVPCKGKNVILLSSMHVVNSIDDTIGEKGKPEVVNFYNSTKSSVDVVDELAATYNCARHTKRWPMVILYSLMNVAGINARIIYTANNNTQNVTPRSFLKTLARELIDTHIKYRATFTNVPPEIKRRRQEIAGVAEKGQNTPVAEGRRKRCIECRGKNNKTKYYCEICNKFLCLGHSKIICSECVKGVLK